MVIIERSVCKLSYLQARIHICLLALCDARVHIMFVHEQIVYMQPWLLFSTAYPFL